MACPCFNDCWSDDLTLNPDDGILYCPNHVITCTVSGCEKKFFDYELGSDFTRGAHCASCPYQGTPFWCDEHIPECQLCNDNANLCESCTVEATDGRFTSLCESCCEWVMDDPCSFAMVKRAES